MLKHANFIERDLKKFLKNAHESSFFNALDFLCKTINNISYYNLIYDSVLDAVNHLDLKRKVSKRQRLTNIFFAFSYLDQDDHTTEFVLTNKKRKLKVTHLGIEYVVSAKSRKVKELARKLKKL